MVPDLVLRHCALFSRTVVREQQALRLVAVLLGIATIVATIGAAKLIAGGPGEDVRLGIFQFYMTTSALVVWRSGGRLFLTRSVC